MLFRSWTEGEDYEFVRGEIQPLIDLRVPENRNLQFNRLDYFVSHGIKGFYIDASGCPGDEEFITYAKDQFMDDYGIDIFIAMEGVRDRNALTWPQIPILKLPYYPESHSELMLWLVSDGTYYGGAINNILTDEEISEILALGYQPILAGGLSTTPQNHQEFMQKWKNWSCKGYENQLERWSCCYLAHR